MIQNANEIYFFMVTKALHPSSLQVISYTPIQRKTIAFNSQHAYHELSYFQESCFVSLVRLYRCQQINICCVFQLIIKLKETENCCRIKH